MRRLYTLLLTSLFVMMLVVGAVFAQPSNAVLATTFTPEVTATADVAQPLVVLMEFDPWNMVLGSDSPRFVLYDNGRVIFIRRDKMGDFEFATSQLDEDDFEELREAFAVGEDFYALDEYYDLLLPTDQPNNFIHVWDEELGEKSVGVYGDLRNDEEARGMAPEAFLDLYDQIVAYDNDLAVTWHPAKFEVMVWPYETSGATEWPRSWPDLEDPTTVEHGGVTSIYLDIELLDTFYELAEDASGAFRINGETYSVSVRYPFPAEEFWMGE